MRERRSYFCQDNNWPAELANECRTQKRIGWLIAIEPTRGIRLGTPALMTRGLKEAGIQIVADFIDRAIRNKSDDGALAKIRGEVAGFTRKFPMPH